MEPEESIRRIKGKRSPQWAFMSSLKIRDKQGNLYLERLRIVATPWFGVYLHHIVAPDPDPAPHDHPWRFGVLVLRGGYVEEFHAMPHIFNDKRLERQKWLRGSFHRMGRESAHRITTVLGGTWTLVFVGRRRGTWGFYTQGTWLSWDEYEQAAA